MNNQRNFAMILNVFEVCELANRIFFRAYDPANLKQRQNDSHTHARSQPNGGSAATDD